MTEVRELRPDQIKDLGRLFYKERRCIHGGEPGTGKTPTVCVLQRARWDKHQHKSVWLMPMKLLDKNYDEAMLWGEWDLGDVVIVDGDEDECERALHSGAKLLLMGFKRFDMCADDIPDEYKGIDIDEWHKGFGHHRSQRTQALYRWCDRRGEDLWFVPMTGTGYNGKPSTLYPAIQIIEPRYYGSPEMFDRTHEIRDPWSGRLLSYTQLDKLESILTHHSIKRLWTDVHGPEKLVAEVIPCRMSARQREAYDQFRETALLELETFFVDGTEPGPAFIRARQIMEHPNLFPNLMEGGTGTVDICPGETPGKLDRFGDDCEDLSALGRPLLAYAALIPQQEQLLEMALARGRKAAIINGKVSNKLAAAADRDFRAGRIDTIIGSPKVADCGYNWQWCGDKEVSDVIFASMDFQDTTFFQAYKRAMREARQSALRILIYTYISTLDQHIMRLVKKKSVDASQVERGRVPVPW